jgi:hypothetical protein
MKFRKKAVVIDAWRFDPYALPGTLPAWIRIEWFCEEIDRLPSGEERRGRRIMIIPTLEGNLKAQVGDWIIRGVKGEVYPCKPDIFQATYEAAE